MSTLGNFEGSGGGLEKLNEEVIPFRGGLGLLLRRLGGGFMAWSSHWWPSQAEGLLGCRGALSWDCSLLSSKSLLLRSSILLGWFGELSSSESLSWLLLGGAFGASLLGPRVGDWLLGGRRGIMSPLRVLFWLPLLKLLLLVGLLIGLHIANMSAVMLSLVATCMQVRYTSHLHTCHAAAFYATLRSCT